MNVSVAIAFALVVLSGRVLDTTTGQPLANVRVSTSAGAHVLTDRAGRYVLRGLRGSRVTLTLESDDVPPQRLDVRLRSPHTVRDLRACSTTLDYRCGAGTPSEGGGAG